MASRTEEFYNGMNTIYDRFRANPPSREGTQVGGIVSKHHTLYAIILRHPNEVSDRVSAISEQVARIAPSMVYAPTTVHTTVLDTVPNGERDGSLEQSLETLGGTFFRDLTIDFGSPLSNRDSVIVPGRPSESFIGLSDTLHQSISRANPTSGARLKKPWGAHITVGRYLTVAPSEVGTEVEKLLAEYGEIGKCRPVSLEVWKCNIGPDAFTQETLAQMKV